MRNNLTKSIKAGSKVLIVFSSLSAIFGAAGVTATNEKEYVFILALSVLGVIIGSALLTEK